MVLGASVSYVRRLQRRTRHPIEIRTPVSDSSDLSVGLLDLNHASARQLEALPGIGPVLSQRIVEYRLSHGRFREVSDLLRVTGIGPKRFALIKQLVTVGSSSDSGVVVRQSSGKRLRLDD
ncbi:MAG: ComEA family DNA-binding protein [candidate division WOR-3 bacterium]